MDITVGEIEFMGETVRRDDPLRGGQRRAPSRGDRARVGRHRGRSGQPATEKASRRAPQGRPG